VKSNNLVDFRRDFLGGVVVEVAVDFDALPLRAFWFATDCFSISSLIFPLITVVSILLSGLLNGFVENMLWADTLRHESNENKTAMRQ
jgi:hypothetical protein